MNILIVNDDGIASPGLACLSRQAARVGSVTVVAPAQQCSGMSHRVSVWGELTLEKVPDFPVAEVSAWKISGNPADCVRAGLQYILPAPPDLVISGINSGYNVGLDILYSGTLGAAREALVCGLPAIAFSVGNDQDLNLAEPFLEPLIRELYERKLPGHELWNVNFPATGGAPYKGRLEDRFPSGLSYYRTVYRPMENEKENRDRVTLQVASVLPAEAEPGSDIQAVLDGYISIGKVANAGLDEGRKLTAC